MRIQERICIWNERLSADISTHLSLQWTLIFWQHDSESAIGNSFPPEKMSVCNQFGYYSRLSRSRFSLPRGAWLPNMLFYDTLQSCWSILRTLSGELVGEANDEVEPAGQDQEPELHCHFMMKYAIQTELSLCKVFRKLFGSWMSAPQIENVLTKKCFPASPVIKRNSCSPCPPGPECPQEIWSEKFMFMLFFLQRDVRFSRKLRGGVGGSGVGRSLGEGVATIWVGKGALMWMDKRKGGYGSVACRSRFLLLHVCVWGVYRCHATEIKQELILRICEQYTNRSGKSNLPLAALLFRGLLRLTELTLWIKHTFYAIYGTRTENSRMLNTNTCDTTWFDGENKLLPLCNQHARTWKCNHMEQVDTLPGLPYLGGSFSFARSEVKSPKVTQK